MINKQAIEHPRLGALANEFASTFSMFEYAMKECGFYDVNKNTGAIETSWMKFSKAHPHIDDAYLQGLRAEPVPGYIIAEPPMYRVAEDDGHGGTRPGWAPPKAVGSMEQLYFAVKRVRNNLFHGDKTAWHGTRDPDLLNSALAVVDCLLGQAPRVKDKFDSGVYLFNVQG